MQGVELSAPVQESIDVSIDTLCCNTWEAYVRYYQDLTTNYSTQANGRTITEYGQDHYENNGAGEGRVLLDRSDIKVYIGSQNVEDKADVVYNVTLADQLNFSDQADEMLGNKHNFTSPGSHNFTTIPGVDYVLVAIGAGSAGMAAEGEPGNTPGAQGGGSGAVGVYHWTGAGEPVSVYVGRKGSGHTWEHAPEGGGAPGEDTVINIGTGVKIEARGGGGGYAPGVDYTPRNFKWRKGSTGSGGDAVISGDEAITDNFKGFTGGTGGAEGSASSPGNVSDNTLQYQATPGAGNVSQWSGDDRPGGGGGAIAFSLNHINRLRKYSPGELSLGSGGRGGIGQNSFVSQTHKAGGDASGYGNGGGGAGAHPHDNNIFQRGGDGADGAVLVYTIDRRGGATHDFINVRDMPTRSRVHVVLTGDIAMMEDADQDRSLMFSDQPLAITVNDTNNNSRSIINSFHDVYVDGDASDTCVYNAPLVSTPEQLRRYNPFRPTAAVIDVTKNGSPFNSQGGRLGDDQALDLQLQFSSTLPTTIFDPLGDSMQLNIDWKCPAGGADQQNMSLSFPVSYTTAPKLNTPVESVFLCWADDRDTPVELKRVENASKANTSPWVSTNGVTYVGSGVWNGRQGEWILEPGTNYELDKITWYLMFQTFVSGKNHKYRILEYVPGVDNNSFISEFSHHHVDIDKKQHAKYNWEIVNRDDISDFSAMFCFSNPQDVVPSSVNQAVENLKAFNRLDLTGQSVVQIEWDKPAAVQQLGSWANQIVYLVEYVSTAGVKRCYIVPDVRTQTSYTYQLRTGDDFTTAAVQLDVNTADEISGFMYTDNSVSVTPMYLPRFSRNQQFTTNTVTSTLPGIQFKYTRKAQSIMITGGEVGDLSDYGFDDTRDDQYKSMGVDNLTVNVQCPLSDGMSRSKGTSAEDIDLSNVFSTVDEKEQKKYVLSAIFTGGKITITTSFGDTIRQFIIPGLGEPDAEIRITGKGVSSERDYTWWNLILTNTSTTGSTREYTEHVFDKTIQWPQQTGVVATNTHTSCANVSLIFSNNTECTTTHSTLTLQDDGMLVATGNAPDYNDAPVYWSDVKVYVDGELKYEQPADSDVTTFVDVSNFI